MKKLILKMIIMVLLTNLLLCNFKMEVQAYSKVLFKNITIEDGLSQPAAQSIIQDKRGYIWIGTTDGLNRYNGYDFEIYRSENKSKNTLKSSYILSIEEDFDGNIWAATTASISKIEFDTNVIKNYDLNGARVIDSLVTVNGDLIFATTEGIHIYNKDLDVFEDLLSSSEKKLKEYIYAIEEDGHGQLWVATKNGIEIINLENKEIKKFENHNYLMNDTISDLFFDKEGYMWIGTISLGLFKVEINTNEICNYKTDKKNDKSLPSNCVNNIYRDSRGILWVCTNNGLASLNEEDETFIRYQNKSNDRYSILSNDIYTLIEDKTILPIFLQ